MKRLARYFFRFTLLLTLLLVAGTGFLISSQLGLDTLLALAKWALPGELACERAQGRLIGPLELEGLRYRDDRTDVTLARANLDWTPSALLAAKLKIDTLHASGMAIHLPQSAPQETQKTPFKLSDIPLPIGVEIADLRISDIRLYPPAAQQPQVIDGIRLKAHTQARTLLLDTLEIELPQGNLNLAGQITARAPYPLNLKLDSSFQHPEYGTLNAQGMAAGDLTNLTFSEKVSGILTATLQGQAHSILQNPSWSALLQFEVANLGRLVPEFDGRKLAGQLQTEGSLNAFEAHAQIDTSLPEIENLKSTLQITGDSKSLTVQQLVLEGLDHSLSLRAQGHIDLTTLQLTAAGEWHKLAWPLIGEPQVQSPEGTFELSGSSRAYLFRLNTQVRGKAIPDSHWQLEGQGSEQALKELKLAGKLLEGEVRGELSLRWQPGLSWQAALSGNGLNPAVQWPELPGKLNFDMHSEGKLTDGKLQTTLNVADLSGILNGQQVKGNAQLALADQDLNLERLRLKAGGAYFEASGSITQRWDIAWQLKVPALGQLLTTASGEIQSSGKLNGPRESPLAEVNFSIQGLSYAGTQIQHLSGEARLDASGTSRSRVNFRGDKLRLAGQSWQDLILEGSGTPREHTFKAGLRGDLGSFVLTLDGALKDTEWQGRLTRLSAQKTALGDWVLDNPVSLTASPTQASIERLCLSSQPTRLCLQGQWNRTSGASGTLTLTDLTADRFSSFLPEDLSVDTRLGGELTGIRRPDGTLQGSVNLQSSPGQISLLANGSPVQIRLGGGYLRAKVQGKEADGTAKLDLGDAGQVATELQLKDLTGQARLAGRIDAEFRKLNLISAFVPDLQAVSGNLTANLALSGPVSAPVIGGEIRLADAATEIPRAAVRIHDIQVTVRGDGRGPLLLSGSARSGPGRLKLSGQLEPAVKRLALTIEGEDFQAVDSTAIKVQISPDIRVSVAGDEIRIEGQIVLPKAYFSPPGDIGGRVNPSPDVIIVKGSTKNGEQMGNGGFAIFAKIRVILGAQVYAEAAGFKGQLKGNLLVEQTPHLAPRGTGTIEVVAGDYTIYGQEITIQRGRLLFSGGPVDNPGLDLRVERPVDEVTSGAEVRGTLKAPKLKLFSEPSMSDTNILSYLVFGHPPEAGSSSQDALLLKAATALGLGMTGANSLSKSIAETFHLDTLSFESGSAANSTSLVIGKYLSPELYVSYGVGLLDKLNTFKLRYRLSKRLTLQSTSTGNASGIDLLYSVGGLPATRIQKPAASAAPVQR